MISEHIPGQPLGRRDDPPSLGSLLSVTCNTVHQVGACRGSRRYDMTVGPARGPEGRASCQRPAKASVCSASESSRPSLQMPDGVMAAIERVNLLGAILQSPASVRWCLYVITSMRPRPRCREERGNARQKSVARAAKAHQGSSVDHALSETVSEHRSSVHPERSLDQMSVQYLTRCQRRSLAASAPMRTTSYRVVARDTACEIATSGAGTSASKVDRPACCCLRLQESRIPPRESLDPAAAWCRCPEGSRAWS